jgi:hypothetical protein
VTAWLSAEPFDLPEWLGVEDVTWVALSPLHRGHLVSGELRGAGDPIACDLLAIDEAYPAPVADERMRTRAHQAWRRGEVHLVEGDGRYALAVPGSRMDAELAVAAVERLARSVGADTASYAIQLRIGRDAPSSR